MPPGVPRAVSISARMRSLSRAVNVRRSGRRKSSGEAAAGAATIVGRRPSSIAPPAVASPELLSRPHRRTFTARDKLRILAEIDTARATPGGIGAVLRREGLYSSALSDWRRQRDGGAFAALHPVPRGPKTTPLNPLATEHARLLRDNQRLTQRLEA